MTVPVGIVQCELATQTTFAIQDFFQQLVPCCVHLTSI
jgi:hypothetical protein